jgi:hypothetical protein
LAAGKYQKMLGNSLRRKISNQKWQDFVISDTNPSQTWQRIRERAKLAINDLTLLAQQLPNEKQEVVFAAEDIIRLMGLILFPSYADLDHDELDSRRTKLAAVLVDKCITKCRYQVKRIIPNRQELSEPITAELQKVVNICKAVSAEIESRQFEAERSMPKYIFSWDKVPGIDEDKLKEFLKKTFYQEWMEGAKIEKSKDGRSIRISNVNNSVSIQLDDTQTLAHISVSGTDDVPLPMKYEKTLLIRNEKGNLAVYSKRYNKRRKSRSDDYNTIPFFG